LAKIFDTPESQIENGDRLKVGDEELAVSIRHRDGTTFLPVEPVPTRGTAALKPEADVKRTLPGLVPLTPSGIQARRLSQAIFDQDA
jgi:hypothetical protein